jgi:hypothetical protein
MRYCVLIVKQIEVYYYLEYYYLKNMNASIAVSMSGEEKE